MGKREDLFAEKYAGILFAHKRMMMDEGVADAPFYEGGRAWGHALQRIMASRYHSRLLRLEDRRSALCYSFMGVVIEVVDDDGWLEQLRVKYHPPSKT